MHEHEHIPKDYYSVNEIVYVTKEDDSPDDVQEMGSTVGHTRKRRHLAEGSIGDDLGDGALGAAGTVAVDKFNSRERSRSVSADRGRKRFRHTRSLSSSRARRSGDSAAMTGLGALAYAAGRKTQGSSFRLVENRDRSRSMLKRRRSRSAESEKAESDYESKRRRTHSRSRSTSSSNTVANVAPEECDGKDIVDFLLEQWTIPIG
jgi:hypothetical protein